MRYFDPEYCDFDDEGFPHLRYHTCSTCNHSCQPDDQILFLDNGVPEGVLAMTSCPKCASSIASALGSPDFMQWIIQQEAFNPQLSDPSSLVDVRLRYSNVQAH